MLETRKIVVLDADGVVLDYNKAVPRVFRKAFGRALPVVRTDAYHAHNVYNLALTKGTSEHVHFYANFVAEDWATMPALEGAVAACHALHAAGFQLICVTSMPPEFAEARERNFRALGLPIEQVVAVGRHGEGNPKLATIERLAPVAFVDDLASNFAGVGPGVHKALVEYGHFDSPNLALDPTLSNSQHGSLAQFVKWWLTARPQRMPPVNEDERNPVVA